MQRTSKEAVDPKDIIEVIKRRRDQFYTGQRAGSQALSDEASRLILEEYDSLLAEIEVFATSDLTKDVVHRPEASSANEEAEAEIFGDQGQSGG